MEVESSTTGCVLLGILFDKMQAKVMLVARDVRQLVKDDPRRVYHAFKVALAITLVSMLYYFRPLYDGFGSSTVWAVMTVVVVFEFSVGAALSKCINRGCATLLAGAAGVGVQRLTALCGDPGRPIVLGIFIFVFAACATFLRFFPYIKARYDYGCLIFTLTFTMVSVTGYLVEEIITYAQGRLFTILLGVAIVIFISVFVYPVWAGEDLHNLIAKNIEKLANYLEGFGNEYFQTSSEGTQKGGIEVPKVDQSFREAYKSVLNSKSSEQSLVRDLWNVANFARWEPFHGRFQLRHPWNLYLNVGAETRQLAYQIDALNGYLNHEDQVPQAFKSHVQQACRKICAESSSALKVLSSSIKTMTIPSSAKTHVDNSKKAVEDLKAALANVSSAIEDLDLLTIVPAATVASILIEIVAKMDKVVQSVEALSCKASFKISEPKKKLEKPLSMIHRASVTPVSVDGIHYVIKINEVGSERSSKLQQNQNNQHS